MRKRLLFGVGGVAAVTSAVVIPILLSVGSSNPRSAGAANLVAANLGATATSPVEQAVEQAENARLATLSPLASTESQSLNCRASDCNISDSLASLNSLPDAANTLVDNPTIGVGAGVESLIKASTGAANVKAVLSVATIVQRNTTLLSGLFAARLGNEFEKSNDRVVSTEVQFLNGTFTGCTSEYSCTIVGAAGAEVTSFTKVSVSGTRATVTLKVHDWQDDAQYVSPSAPLSWQRVAGTLIVVDTLQQVNGLWQIVNRSSSFASGTMP
jgi:hypothetical protein